MFIAMVIGTVVSTRKDEALVGQKILMVQPLDAHMEPDGKIEVAVDSVGAGTGEIVLVTMGSIASKPFENSNAPIDCTIVGIIDSVEASNKGR
ncbi:MAG: EutN/CcmL family microcompartment protein [Bacillota bacterium]